MLSRTQIVRFAALAFAITLTGCHKKVKVTTPPLPPITVPAESMPQPVPEAPSMPPPTPTGPGVSEPIPIPERPTTSPRRTTTRPAANPTATPPVSNPNLGDLTEGGAADANTLRAQAQNLIVETDRRLQRLSTEIKQQKARQLGQVQQFLNQAKDALSAGDPAGANNLATKSKLLLDDLLK